MNAARLLCALLLLLAPAALAGEPHLVGLWRFDEADGLTVRDSSGNGLDGRIVNPENVERVRGRSDGALAFAGTDEERGKSGCVLVAGIRQVDLSRGLTIEAWTRFSPQHVRQETCYIAADGPWKGPGWRFIVSYDGLFLQSGDGEIMWGAGVEAARLGGFEKNRWYHLAGTFDGSTYRLYVDGLEVAESKPDLTLTRGTDTLSVGSYSGGMTSVFRGAIDEIKLYDRARPHIDILKDARLRR